MKYNNKVLFARSIDTELGARKEFCAGEFVKTFALSRGDLFALVLVDDGFSKRKHVVPLRDILRLNPHFSPVSTELEDYL